MISNLCWSFSNTSFILLFSPYSIFPNDHVKPSLPCSKAPATFQFPSLPVQWLGLCAFIANGLGLIPSQGTKTSCATWLIQKKKKKTTKTVRTIIQFKGILPLGLAPHPLLSSLRHQYSSSILYLNHPFHVDLFRSYSSYARVFS